MSAGTVPSLPLAVVAGPAEQARMPGAATALSRREASLRAGATTGLAGIALLQAIAMPAQFADAGRLVGLPVAATALCLALSLALAIAPASASRPVWRMVAATAVLVLAGWAVPHAVTLPDVAGARGDWASMPGVGCGALAAACLLLAAAALRPGRATARGLATALAVLVVSAPGAGALLVAFEPGPAGGETAIAADVHVHQHSTASEADIKFRPGPNGNHYVTPVSTPPHAPALGVALVVAAAFVLVAGAVAYLRDRSAPPRPVVEGGLA